MEIIHSCEAYKRSNKVYQQQREGYINIINEHITNACNEGKYECKIKFKDIIPEQIIQNLEEKGYKVSYDRVCHYQLDGYEDDKTTIKITW